MSPGAHKHSLRLARERLWCNLMARALSSGVLVRCGPGLLLLGHASGTRHWDIPKGLVEPDEEPRAAAARELQEETGLVLEPSAWQDLGRLPYNRAKDLWLFRTAELTVPLDCASLRCVSTFTDRFGRTVPEFDRFAVVARSAIDAHCAPSMARLLEKLDW